VWGRSLLCPQGIMHTFGKGKKLTARSKRRKQRATMAKAIDCKPQPAHKITKALNAVYATEDSSLDPVIAQLQATALGRGEW